MRRKVYLALALAAACATAVVAQTTPAKTAPAQDDGELRIRRALEGRFVVTKMDLPAIETGVEMIFDDANVSYDDAAYKRMVKDNGVAVKKGSRAKITGVRISPKGIEIDLDGGGSPARDWVVRGVTLTDNLPSPKSERELDLERQLQAEPNSLYIKTEIEYERQRRLVQDDRNREAFARISRLRSEYIEENRKAWGSKLIIVVRSRKPTVTMREMMKSLSQYVEILPREPAGT